MSRELHEDTLSAFQRSSLNIFHLYTFEFSSVFRLTDNVHDITYDFGNGPETFTSNGRISSFSNVDETIDITNPTISIVFTGANAADISLALSENFNNRRVIVRKGMYDDSGETKDSNIIAKPFIVFDGRVESWHISDNPLGGNSTVTWKVASHWADWTKVSGRKCNNEDAKMYFPSESGFSFIYDQIGDVIWGRVRT